MSDFVEWPLNDEGIPYRQAARIIILDGHNRIFMIRGHDIDQSAHTWWFTPGGGREGTETSRATAVRELAEETGIEVTQSRLIGPVIKHNATFHFSARIRKQDQDYFLLYVDDGEAAALEHASNKHWTELEKKVLDEQRWWDITQLAALQATGIQVFPVDLLTLVENWSAGWDGICHTIIEH